MGRRDLVLVLVAVAFFGGLLLLNALVDLRTPHPWTEPCYDVPCRVEVVNQ